MFEYACDLEIAQNVINFSLATSFWYFRYFGKNDHHRTFSTIDWPSDLEVWIERKKNVKSRSFDEMDKICLLIFAFRLVKIFFEKLKFTSQDFTLKNNEVT